MTTRTIRQRKNQMKKDFWQDMRDEGFILMDAPDRKLAVFPNDIGFVVIASHEDHKTHISTVESDEVGALVAALLAAQERAQQIFDAIEPEYQTHLAITKAMGVA